MNIKKIHFICLVNILFNYNLANAGLFDDNEARTAILDMRKQITQTKQQQEQNYNQIQTGIIALQNQIDNLQNDKKNLLGQLESINNDIIKLKSNYQTLANSYTDRLDAQQKAIEELKENKVTNENNNSDIGDTINNSIKANTTQSLINYNGAVKLFHQSNFAKSAEMFNILLSENSEPSLMPLIIYYLGSSYYALQKYKLAIIQLNSFLNNYPNHEKVPNVYFALASSYLELGDKNNARKNFEYLIKNYSNNNLASIAKKRLNDFKN